MFGGGVFFDLTRWVILAGIVLVLVSTFLYTIFVVDGVSMEPNLHDREFVLLGKNSYLVGKTPKRGDVVVVEYPGDPERKHYVKRVVGLPGDEVKISEGQVFINNSLARESYLTFDIRTEPAGTWKMSDKEYFLMGDNRPNSNDSRYFGGVEKRFFLGRAVFIIYPRLRAIESQF